MVSNLPGSSVHETSQVRILEWVTISSSRGSAQLRDGSQVSCTGRWKFFTTKVIWKKVKVKIAQLCLTLCDPMDYTVHAVLQARILEWVAFTSPGDLPNPGIEPRSSTLQVDSLSPEPQEKPKATWEPLNMFALSNRAAETNRTERRNRGILKEEQNHWRVRTQKTGQDWKSVNMDFVLMSQAGPRER